MCFCLKPIFTRKNQISSLSEVLWLRPLRQLASLMMSENPCSEDNSRYRHTGALTQHPSFLTLTQCCAPCRS